MKLHPDHECELKSHRNKLEAGYLEIDRVTCSESLLHLPDHVIRMTFKVVEFSDSVPAKKGTGY